MLGRAQKLAEISFSIYEALNGATAFRIRCEKGGKIKGGLGETH